MKIETVRQVVAKALNGKANLMTKIRHKCWLYHSESRTNSGNEPFEFENYIRNIGKEFYLDYIASDLIDCTDIGGKDVAIQAVENWYK